MKSESTEQIDKTLLDFLTNSFPLWTLIELATENWSKETAAKTIVQQLSLKQKKLLLEQHMVEIKEET